MASPSQFVHLVESISSISLSSSTDESLSNGDHQMISQRYRKRVQNMMNLLIAPQMVKLLSLPVRRRRICNDREGSHRQIWRDYFADDCSYPSDYFRRRYRMHRELFLRILKDIEAYCEYFVPKKDCTRHRGCSSIQKMITAIHIQAYGLSSDHYDEYLKSGETTVINNSIKLITDNFIELIPNSIP
ncbi:uncharacterized protein LOC114292835 [Camellia sinensis]|uniref:uncharacterized protein LOC114292835 n=1 Tax=Camellia sinensis TaxID=4442 RepID=UPI0010365FB5|nr:uncharacterized protein LOC114292835 [Camellia sinensis]